MANKQLFFKFSALAGVIFCAVLFLAIPAGASACGTTKINYPADGQNLDAALPHYAQPTFEISENNVYYLNIYFGTPGNATLVNGHSEGWRPCDNTNQIARDQDLFSQSGDYFYVLYNATQVADFSQWNSYWTSGTFYPFPLAPSPSLDYAISKFSINKTQTLEPVIIIPGILGSSDKDGVWVIDPILHTYDNLIDTLKANGYTDGQNLFTMPYDWRQSNVLTAIQLRDKIREVEAICTCQKVDLVAHSMGGLVARQYIESAQYENNVDHLIFLGTPHLGAPKAYLMWEGGEFGTRTLDKAFKFILSKEAEKSGFNNTFDYVRNKPISSVQELLPTYDYLRDKLSGILRVYPNNYPQNNFLENLNNGVTNLLNKGIKITNIVGELGDITTLNTIRVVSSTFLPLWENGYPDGFNGSTSDKGLELGFGDGTVSKNSSEFIASDLNELSSEHIALPTDAEGLVFKKLTGQEVKTSINSFHIPNAGLLIIKILSPVDVVVTAPDGKRIGKDFATNQEVNEIPGAFYSGFKTDNEYLTIPNPLDGEYKVTTQGTGTGHYTVATGYISDNISVDKDFTAQTQPGLVSDLSVVINNSNSLAPSIDIKPKDTTPPEIKVISPEAKDYSRSDTLPINVSIVDKDSGIFSQEIRFDDTIVSSVDSIDLFFQKLGAHSLKANASDFVGNATSTIVNLRVVATPDSTISDLERSFSLGWIKSKKEKDELVKDLNKTIKLESRIEVLEQKLPNGTKLTKRIEKIEKRIDKILGKSFLKELQENYKKGIINDKAFNLLTEDINWLLNN